MPIGFSVAGTIDDITLIVQLVGDDVESLGLGISMPLRCISSEGDELSFEHDADSWAALRERNSRARHLRFTCCDAGVILKTSSLGTRYFAHQARGGCDTAPETQEHLRAKTIICKALKDAGWIATPEHRMTDADGVCIADVLGKRVADASKGIAFEVQWSPQLEEVTKARTDRYTEHGLRSLWLMKRPMPLNSKDVPVARLVSTDQGFDVYIPSESLVRGAAYMSSRDISDLEASWRRCGTLAEFARAVVEGRFRFGIASEFDIRVTVGGVANWCYACGTETQPATWIVLDLGHLNPDFPNIFVEIHELGQVEGGLAERILESINVRLPNVGGYRLGQRKPKESTATYLANVCRCGAFLSRSYLPHPSDKDRVLLEFDLTTTAHDVKPFYKVIDRWCFIDPANPPSKPMLGLHGFGVPNITLTRLLGCSFSADGPLGKVRHVGYADVDAD
ncbi:competence protein CoiA [Rhizobium johnstonii]|uniref:competence protein CoiA n=1 Tax=Rhizobium johnstonii TaxID=3019933 RepID=UPI003F9B71AD